MVGAPGRSGCTASGTLLLNRNGMSGTLSPQAMVAALEARARLVRTPFEGGEMEWRVRGDGEPSELSPQSSGYRATGLPPDAVVH